MRIVDKKNFVYDISSHVANRTDTRPQLRLGGFSYLIKMFLPFALWSLPHGLIHCLLQIYRHWAISRKQKVTAPSVTLPTMPQRSSTMQDTTTPKIPLYLSALKLLRNSLYRSWKRSLPAEGVWNGSVGLSSWCQCCPHHPYWWQCKAVQIRLSWIQARSKHDLNISDPGIICHWFGHMLDL